jgi:hypothetical protein
MGDAANTFALNALMPMVLAFIEGNPDPELPFEWALLSLGHIHTKIWIHQGRWLRKVPGSYLAPNPLARKI